MAVNYTFQRIEKKYLLTKEKYEILTERIRPYMQMDEYGLHTICNIYYDTEAFDLIRVSIAKPVYKEKLRLRSYGIPQKGDKVFLEIKKKWKGVVYKRRIALTLEDAENYLEKGVLLKEEGQIQKEIDYFIKFYQPIARMYIAYDREAYFGIEDPSIRITFDKNIRSRNENLQLAEGDSGELLLQDGERLMEIKIGAAFPLWLAQILSKMEIYPLSFSKYGNIYKRQVIADNVTLYGTENIYNMRKEEGIGLCLQAY